jgi:hypothetical protein
MFMPFGGFGFSPFGMGFGFGGMGFIFQVGAAQAACSRPIA